MECPQQEGSKLVNGRTPNHTHKAWHKVKIGAQEKGAYLSPIHFQPCPTVPWLFALSSWNIPRSSCCTQRDLHPTFNVPREPSQNYRPPREGTHSSEQITLPVVPLQSHCWRSWPAKVQMGRVGQGGEKSSHAMQGEGKILASKM